jgi:hypothetical protein
LKSQPQVDLTYIKQGAEPNGPAGDQYTGLDRFGRIVDQRWLATATGAPLDQFRYGYDRDSNRLFKENEIALAFSELYHADVNSQINEIAAGMLVDYRNGKMMIQTGPGIGALLRAQASCQGPPLQTPLRISRPGATAVCQRPGTDGG